MHHQGSSYQTSASTLVYQQQLYSTYQDIQSDELNEDNISYNYEEVLELDYADSLNLGYRFSPTDSEIIVYYLQRKIKTGEQHPECRYYIADFYGDTPDNLAGKIDDTMKLSDLVLAKIYKKDENQNKNRMNPKELMEDQNQLQDRPSPSQRRYQQLAIQHMDTLSGSYMIHPTFQDPPQAYNSYQDSEHPQATLQSFSDEPMEWTEDDISKEIEENLDEENMSARSSIDVLQEANNYYQSFHAQPTEWT
nr:NAC domain-containing protein [Tanacetum cinerariifolium]